MRKNNSLTDNIRVWANSLVDLILPRVCSVCGTVLVEGEDIMCLNCLVNLPVSGMHDRQPNEIHERLISLRTPIEKATSYFYYNRDNPYARLIHDTKYRNRPRVGRKLAATYASQIISIGFFDDIDALVPIPIHFLKRLKRSYNQSEEIAKGVSLVTGIPIEDHLHATRYHSSQTRKSATVRRLNVSGSFSVRHSSDISGKHLLIIDDVITTGSTMLSAMEALKSYDQTVRLSVFSLALTHNY